MSGKDKKQSNWSREAIVYQIYPHSFKDSNNDGIGDLQGIIDMLDYLNDGTEKSLGINAIWLSPIYKSPMVDFGYDISDYENIDPVFGNLETFARLIKEARRRKIRIIMDFVANHTSIKHPWFSQSRSSKDNSKRDWYIWADPKPNGEAPNNWRSVFGGSSWTLDRKTNQYYLHTFLPQQPDLNWRNNEVKKAMEKVLEFWLHKGVDGFRSDATYHLIKDAKLRDDPPNPAFHGNKNSYDSLIHIYSQSRPEALDTVKTFCSVLGLHKNKYLVSEAYLDIPEMVKLYKACSNNLHAPFNFNLISLPWEAKKVKRHIDEFEATLGKNDWPNYVLGNHDSPRVSTRVGEKRARLLAMLLLSLRGMPFIYYGEEIGMKNVDIPTKLKKDLSGNFLNEGRDGERTPMQWNSRVFAGFSSEKPWLPVDRNYREVNVEKELNNPSSMLSLYRHLIHYRRGKSALMYGSYRSKDVDNSNVFAFLRELDNDKVLIMLNFSDKEEPVASSYRSLKVACDTERKKEGMSLDARKIKLTPYQGYITEVIR